jgi:hypothetical protein
MVSSRVCPISGPAGLHRRYRELLPLLCISCTDTGLTVALLLAGLALEQNPVLAYPLRHWGLPGFLLAKVGMFTLGPLALLGWLKYHPAMRPVFYRRLVQAGMAAYLAIFFGGTGYVTFR